MKINIQYYSIELYLLNIFIILVSLFWFYPFDFFYLFWDQGFYFFRNAETFKNIFFPYIDHLIYPGFDNPSPLSWIYISSIHYFFTQIFSYKTSQLAYVIITLLISVNGYYFLLRRLSKLFNLDNKFISLFAIGMSFFHYHSFYSLGDLGPNYLFYAFLPVSLYFYIDILTRNKSFFIFFLSVFLQSQSFTLPVYFVNYIIYLLIFSIIISSRNNSLEIFKKSFFIIIFVFAFLSFYLVNTIIGSTEYLNNQISNVGGENFLKGFLDKSTIIDIILFQNFDLLNNNLFLSYGPWVSFYSSIYFKIILIIFYIYFFLKIILLRIPKNFFLIFLIFLLICSIPLHFHFIGEFLISKFNFLLMYRGWSQKVSHFYEFGFILMTYVLFNNKFDKDNYFKIFSIIILIILTFSTLLGLFFYKSSNIKFANKYNTTDVFQDGVSSKVYLNENMNELISLDISKNSNIFVLPRSNILSFDQNQNKNIYFNLYNRLLGTVTSNSYGGQPEINRNLLNNLKHINNYDDIIQYLKNFNFTHILFVKNSINNDYFTDNFKLNYDKEFKQYLNKKYDLILNNNNYLVYKINHDYNEILGRGINFIKLNPLLYVVNNPYNENLITLNSIYNKKWLAKKVSIDNDISLNKKGLFQQFKLLYQAIFFIKLNGGINESFNTKDNLKNNFKIDKGKYIIFNLKLVYFYTSILFSIFILFLIGLYDISKRNV